MSLYCFGRLISSVNVELMLEGSLCRVLLPDAEDARELEKEEGLQKDGVFFMIADLAGGGDATKLWCDAMLCPERSQMGEIIRRIIECEAVEIGSIGFVDGGAKPSSKAREQIASEKS